MTKARDLNGSEIALLRGIQDGSIKARIYRDNDDKVLFQPKHPSMKTLYANRFLDETGEKAGPKRGFFLRVASHVAQSFLDKDK